MKGSRLHILFITLGLLLVLSVGWVQAQEPGVEESQPQGGNAAAAILSDAIPIQ